MDIIRVNNIQQFVDCGFDAKIRNRLTFKDERLREPYMGELTHKLLHNPECVFFLLGLDDKTPHDLKAFIIAFNPGVNIPFVCLSQIWAMGNQPDWYKPFLAKLVMWTHFQGKDYIRGETIRNTEAIHRRFGFEPSTEIMTLSVQKGLQDLFQHTPEEIQQWVS